MGLARTAASKPAPPWNPAPLTPTPEGMKQWEKVQKALAKKAAKQKKNPPATTSTTRPQGKGGKGEKLWETLGDLAKNGLPG